MPINFNSPVATDNYLTLVANLKDSIGALAMMLDPTLVGTVTGAPTGAKRINESTSALERWNGTSWTNQAVNGLKLSAGVSGFDNSMIVGNLATGMATIVPGGASAITPIFGANRNTTGAVALGAYVADGTNNLRAALFVDHTNSEWGLSSSASVTPAGFKFTIGHGSTKHFSIDASGVISALTASLLVQGGSLASPGLAVFGDTNTGLASLAADTLSFVAGGVEVFSANSAGNVGFGVAPGSTYRIDVVGLGRFSSNSLPQITVDRPGSSVNSLLGYSTTSGTVYAGQGAANTFAIGGSSNLTSSPWLQVSSSGVRAFSAGYGLLGLRDGGAYGGAGPNSNIDALVLESNGNTGISILTPNTAIAQIRFGDSDLNAGAGISHNNSGDITNLIGVLSGAGSTFLSASAGSLSVGAGWDLILPNAAPTNSYSAGYRGMPYSSGGSTTPSNRSLVGRCYDMNSGGTFTVNSGVYEAGDVVCVLNAGLTDSTIAQGTGMTLRKLGTTSSGSATLAGRGMATLYFQSASVCFVGGPGVS